MTLKASAIENKKVLQSQVAMTVALVSWSMLFATLFLGYALFRFNSAVWPPAELREIGLRIPLLSTLVIGLSSVAYALFEKKVLHPVKNEQDLAIARRYLFATLFSGVAFLTFQFLFWNELKAKNIFASAGVFPSILYSFTWVHAAHIVLGLIALLWALPLVWKKERFEQEVVSYASRVQSIGKFWHFLGAVWLVMFVTLFLI